MSPPELLVFAVCLLVLSDVDLAATCMVSNKLMKLTSSSMAKVDFLFTFFMVLSPGCMIWLRSGLSCDY